METTYRYRPGTRVAVPAQVAGEALEAIRERCAARDERMLTGAVVEAARPCDAPLHPAFSWDDSVAGEKWRRHEARNLIRSVMVVTTDTETGTEESHTVYVSVNKGKDAYYDKATVVVQSIDAYASAIENLHSKITAARAALADLQAVARDQPDPNRAMLAGVIAQAFATASQALSQLAH